MVHGCLRNCHFILIDTKAIAGAICCLLKAGRGLSASDQHFVLLNVIFVAMSRPIFWINQWPRSTYTFFGQIHSMTHLKPMWCVHVCSLYKFYLYICFSNFWVTLTLNTLLSIGYQHLDIGRPSHAHWWSCIQKSVWEITVFFYRPLKLPLKFTIYIYVLDFLYRCDCLCTPNFRNYPQIYLNGGVCPGSGGGQSSTLHLLPGYRSGSYFLAHSSIDNDNTFVTHRLVFSFKIVMLFITPSLASHTLHFVYSSDFWGWRRR